MMDNRSSKVSQAAADWYRRTSLVLNRLTAFIENRLLSTARNNFFQLRHPYLVSGPQATDYITNTTSRKDLGIPVASQEATFGFLKLTPVTR